jgi:hypothetical protein
MARLAGFPTEMYAALERIRETALRRFDSLFTPDRPIWTHVNVRSFHAHFVGGFDEGEGDFLEKYETQLRGAEPDVTQFAAELLYVQQFFTSLTKADKKLRNVEAVLAWLPRPVAIPAWARDGLAKGLAGDQSFNQQRPYQLAWLADFLLAWHGLDESSREVYLADPWRFRELVDHVKPSHKAFQPIREAWLYLIFPDTFENISSRRHKKRIREGFSTELAMSPTDSIDRDLLEIRARLSREVEEGFSFYDKALAERWQVDDEEPAKPSAEPEVSREAILQAMALFDREQRASAEWERWEANRSHKYAVVHDGRRYPAKQVLSLATGKERNTFSGGTMTNKHFVRAGFVVEELAVPAGPLAGLQAALIGILAQYGAARGSGPYTKHHPVLATFRQAQSAIKASPPVASRPTLSVEYSAGKGKWAAVPWIALLDTRETQSTQAGRYVVLLFKADQSGVYLALNQGVTGPTNDLGRHEGLKLLRERATAMRRQVAFLEQRGFSFDDSISVEHEGQAKDYDASTVAYRFYAASAVPGDDDLQHDLEAVLEAYDLVLEAESSAWIFQANPGRFDLSGALDELSEMTWLVTRHAGDIAVGDRVYLWESGPDAGIVASATVIEEVREREEDEVSLRFWRQERDSLPAARVMLRIDQVLEERIPKRRLVDDARFADLGFLRAPQGTNFAITEAHRRAIDEFFVPPILEPDDLCASFARALRTSGLSFGEEHDSIVRCFLGSLMAKPLVLLTGLSGSGKTQLALKLAEWLGGDRYRVVPVRPDWTGPESLLGYEDALLPADGDRRAWHVPDALELMLRATRDPQHAFVLILDEMNLAHVERYFADVLSGIESREAVLPNLEKGDDGYWRISSRTAARVVLPRNLFVLGTVNVDETTYMFSPKVLDRANTIEFRVPTSALPTDLTTVTRPLRSPPATELESTSLLRIALDDGWQAANAPDSLDELATLVRQVHEGLTMHSLEFGHRTYYETLRLASILYACGFERTPDVLDVFLLQKVLPRLHGSRRKIEPVLRMLGAFAYELRPPTAGGDFDVLAERPNQPAKMPRSFAKLRRMMRALYANQFTSFSD